MASEKSFHLRRLASIRELVREVSQESHLAPEVVEQVLLTFRDIMIEAVVNGREVVFPHFFTLKESAPIKHNTPTTGVSTPKPRVNLRLSASLRTLRRLQQNSYSSSPYLINRSNWEGALRWAYQEEKTTAKALSSKKNQQLPAEEESSEAFANPFLEEDYGE